MIQQEFSSITQELLVLLYILLTWIINGRMTVDSYEVVSDSQSTRFCVEGFKTSTPAAFWIRRAHSIRGGRVLSCKRLIGMCRLMGSHFHDWSDYNGVANFRIFEIGRDSNGKILGKKIRKWLFIKFNNKLALTALHSPA